MKTEKIELDSPVKSAGVEVKALTIREPKVRDMLASETAGKSDAEREVAMFASLCEVEPETVKDLTVKDYRKLQEAYQAFLS